MYGNYLFQFYRVIKKTNPVNRAFKKANKVTARQFARLLAMHGIAVGPTTGHFQYLQHMDPTAPLPAQAPSQAAARTPMGQWVDSFVSARYDVSYRPNRRGALSEMLQLGYADGTKVDIDIWLISDNYDPAPAHAVMYSYMGRGNRLYPLRMGRSTTPRLWQAKHQIVLAKMYQSNREFEELTNIALTGVLSTVPLGLVVPVPAPTPSPRPIARAPQGASGVSGRTAAPVGSTRTAAPAQRAVAQRSGTAGTAGVPVARRPAQGARAGTPATRAAAQAARARAPGKLAWPPQPPRGRKPAINAPGAAEWRYQRYVYNAYKKGKAANQVLPYATWKRRHFTPAANGGRPGRPGGKAHRDDVRRNNEPNKLDPDSIGRRVPDGVGQPGQVLIIRNRRVIPDGNGRVIVESDHFIHGGRMPNSAARAQLRDIRRSEPGATLVITDVDRPDATPLVYPPGTQPPPPGRLPKGQTPTVPYP